MTELPRDLVPTLEAAGIKHTPANSDRVVAEVLAALDRAGPHPDQCGWDAHWSGYDRSGPPTYLDRGQRVFRYRGQYVEAEPDAEARFFTELKQCYFRHYFSGLTGVAEFGCGTGQNLREIREWLGLETIGFDWSPAATRLTAEATRGSTRVFNMLEPDAGVQDACWAAGDSWASCGVLTSGSMEQLGEGFRPFLDFLVGLRAAVYLHIEPIVELYDRRVVFDNLAALYHEKRGYLGRFLTALEARPEVHIVEATRTGFGNMLNEGYSVVAWRLGDPDVAHFRKSLVTPLRLPRP